MKSLYIVRHAKSSWDHPGLEDFQRPLMEKGKKRSKYIVDFFQEEKIHVDLIISSHAVRAHETAKILAKGMQYPKSKILISKNLYFGYSDNVFDVFNDLPDDVNSVMIVGHNPTFTNFANYFLDQKIDNLPTSGVVCIAFDMDSWANIQDASSKVKFVISPRSLREKLS